ncbi:hypothetical protein ABH939_006673 [Rhodococcus sp. 27YEA6]
MLHGGASKGVRFHGSGKRAAVKPNHGSGCGRRNVVVTCSCRGAGWRQLLLPDAGIWGYAFQKGKRTFPA